MKITTRSIAAASKVASSIHRVRRTKVKRIASWSPGRCDGAARRNGTGGALVIFYREVKLKSSPMEYAMRSLSLATVATVVHHVACRRDSDQ